LPTTLPVEALFFFLLLIAAFFFLFAGGGWVAGRLREGRTEEEVLAAWRAEWRVLAMLEDGMVKNEF
jgi:hypothetical protein